MDNRRGFLKKIAPLLPIAVVAPIAIGGEARQTDYDWEENSVKTGYWRGYDSMQIDVKDVVKHDADTDWVENTIKGHKKDFINNITQNNALLARIKQHG